MGNLLELARNPRMLTFVATLDEERLRAMHDQGGGQISAADLYREIIDFWLAEEATRQQHPRGLRSLGRNERFRACTALALRMWESGETTIGLGDLSEEVSATLTGLTERGYSEDGARDRLRKPAGQGRKRDVQVRAPVDHGMACRRRGRQRASPRPHVGDPLGPADDQGDA